MKTTLAIPDTLFKRAEAAAARSGSSFQRFVTEALEAHLGRETDEVSSHSQGWRKVFGQAQAEDVEPVDAIISKEFERIEASGWR